MAVTDTQRDHQRDESTGPLARLLHRLGVPETLVVDALAERLSHPAQGAAALSHTDESFLRAHGDVLHRTPEERTEAEAGSIAAFTAMLIEARTVGQLADTLGVSASRVRHQVRGRELYAVKTRGELRLPAWQFIGGTPIPGLRAVLNALPTDLHPLSVQGFFTTPQPELLGDNDAALSPVHWLSSGGSVAPVTELAAALADVP